MRPNNNEAAGAANTVSHASEGVLPRAAAPARRVLLAVQLALTLAILALLPGGWSKLVAFLAVWALTFREISPREFAVYLGVCALFSVMDAMAVRQGVFRFERPDYLGLPVWEFFMWGFYVLHAARALGGPVPAGSLAKSLALAALFAVPFVTLANPWLLLAASGLALAVAFAFFHERSDFVYAAYLAALGALIEYAGVWAGEWSYPADPAGGVPPWFVLLWGGVGLFTRRLLLPLLYPPPRGSGR